MCGGVSNSTVDFASFFTAPIKAFSLTQDIDSWKFSQVHKVLNGVGLGLYHGPVQNAEFRLENILDMCYTQPYVFIYDLLLF